MRAVQACVAESTSGRSGGSAAPSFGWCTRAAARRARRTAAPGRPARPQSCPGWPSRHTRLTARPDLRSRSGVAEDVQTEVAVGRQDVLLAVLVVPDLDAPEVVAAFVNERADLLDAVLAVLHDPETRVVVRDVGKAAGWIHRDFMDRQRPGSRRVGFILRLGNRIRVDV